MFELITQTPEGNLTVCGGGRYDNLVEELGGPSIPAAGFGMGIERLLMLLDSEGVQLPCPDTLDVFVTYMGQAKLAAFRLVEELRAAGIKADMDHCGRSLKAQFKFANKTGAPLTATLGEEELAQGVVKLRDMNTRQERIAPMAEVAEAIMKCCAGKWERPPYAVLESHEPGGRGGGICLPAGSAWRKRIYKRSLWHPL